MIINPSAPSGYTIFCDDIRHEISGKTTLVGVYNNQMIVTGQVPVTLPQLCAAITLRLIPREETLKPTIKIFRTDQEEALFVCEAEIDAVDKEQFSTPRPHLEADSITFMQIGITAQMQGLVIEKPCALKVRAFLGDDEIRLGSLQISVVQPETPADVDGNNPAK